MGDVVIAAYKPIPGREAALEELARTHARLADLPEAADMFATFQPLP